MKPSRWLPLKHRGWNVACGKLEGRPFKACCVLVGWVTTGWSCLMNVWRLKSFRSCFAERDLVVPEMKVVLFE